MYKAFFILSLIIVQSISGYTRNVIGHPIPILSSNQNHVSVDDTSNCCCTSGINFHLLETDNFKRDSLIEKIIDTKEKKQKKRIINDVICVLYSNSYNDTAKEGINCILAEFKPKKAIPALIECLKNNRVSIEVPFSSHFCSAYYPLIEIGKPAKRDLIEHLNYCTTDRDFFFTMITLIRIMKWNKDSWEKFYKKKMKKAPKNILEYYKTLQVDIEMKMYHTK